jgi:hypothetical protein
MSKKLYQIVDLDGEPMGLIYTTADEDVVESTWKEIYSQDEPEDSSYVDMLEEKLSENYETERIFIEETIYP